MRRPPRVIFLNRFFYPDHSSTAQLLTDLAFDLSRVGVDVAVITSRLKYDDPLIRLPRREQVQGVNVHRVFSSGFGRGRLSGRAVDLLSFYISAFAHLLKVARRGDLIVAKTDPPLLSILAQGAAALTGARIINWLQDIYPEVASALGVRALNGLPGRLLVTLRNSSLRAAEANVVLSERMALHLRASGIPPHKIQIIPNWSDEEAITPVDHAANDLRTSWGLDGKFVVGYSGNLGRAHEWETMLGAARTLKDHPDIAFLMVGDGHHMGALRAAAEKERLLNIVFQPYQPASALAASLSAADLHWISLNPELEGLVFPSKIYGVLAAGRPILAVVDEDGQVARVVREHQCGLHIALGDHEGFAQAVRQLMADAQMAAAMGAAARKAAIETYSRGKALATWRELIQSTASSQQR